MLAVRFLAAGELNEDRTAATVLAVVAAVPDGADMSAVADPQESSDDDQAAARPDFAATLAVHRDDAGGEDGQAEREHDGSSPSMFTRGYYKIHGVNPPGLVTDRG
ncbi:MAG TPA: hypothetical protein VFW64_12390 [Pseudonocardiaceae bacterium]|nr:hypothetical protein [Pseudonocardiaceae bacterium]